MLYAIVDIETSGGYASAAGITEIAIIITDGVTVIEEYETLINPLQNIPYYITKLTGINNATVAAAPTFAEVAPTIYNLLLGKIFVAHNVNFDYSFVNHQLKQNGYELNSKKLCTVRYGKKVITGLRSYSLGNFCKAVGITVTNRHRAGGDCMATFYLLKRLLAEDVNGELSILLKNIKSEKNLPLQLQASEYGQLPNSMGVYYFYDSKQKLIYVGKAINIKKRVASHFAGNAITKQRQEFIRNIATIKYTLVATELMCLILESTEIKKYWPKYNKAQKRYEHQFAIYSYTNQNDVMQLCVEKRKKNLPYIVTAKNHVDGLNILRNMVVAYKLCPNFCMLTYMATELVHHTCNGTCSQYKTVRLYNNNLQKAIVSFQKTQPSFLLVGEGLEATEQSVIVFVNGNFEGMGYIPKAITTYTYKIVQPYITTYKTNEYINNLILNYSEQQHAAIHIIKATKAAPTL